jgi:predicted glycoside hydrolase/deacetylase ChbG (UPF0249 family)
MGALQVAPADARAQPRRRERLLLPHDLAAERLSAQHGLHRRQAPLDEVERELRAQIELLRKHLPRVSHVSTHMGAAMATPELRELTRRLAAEYGLGFGDGGRP